MAARRNRNASPLVILIATFLTGCHDVNFALPAGTVCTLYTVPGGVPAVTTTAPKVPAKCTWTTTPTGPVWLTINPATIPPSMTGTPQVNDFGTFTITATGTCPGTLWGTNTWTVTATIYIASPSTPTVSPTGGWLINSTTGNNVSVTVTTAACTANFQVGNPVITSGTNQVTAAPSPTATTTSGTLSESLTAATDTDATGTVDLTLTPTGSGVNPVSVTIPFTLKFP